MVEFDESVSEERESWLGERLTEANAAASSAMAKLGEIEAGNECPLHVFALDDRGEIIGGLTGNTWGYWLHVDLLWVREDHRKGGLGGQLLDRAESAASSERECSRSRVETWEFQARAFYEKHGYEIVGEVRDYPPGVTEYLLVKELE